MAKFHRKSVLSLALFSCIKALDSAFRDSALDAYYDYDGGSGEYIIPKHGSNSRKFECPNYETVYIMGETGTGKSTMANFMIGKSLLDDDPDQCFPSGSSEISVTRAVKSCDTSANGVFPLFGNGTMLKIKMIDTPGLGDMTVVQNNVTLTTEEADLHTLKKMALHFNEQDCVSGIIVLRVVHHLEVLLKVQKKSFGSPWR